METLMYNAASFLRVTPSQYGKDFRLSTTSVALLVRGVKNPAFLAIYVRALSI